MNIKTTFKIKKASFEAFFLLTFEPLD